MSTTSTFQILPDYFPTEKECTNAEHTCINTNPRYSNFTQTHFTAGDIDQFELYRSPTNGEPDPSFTLSQNLFQNYTFMFSDKYKLLSTETINNTFSYIFHKFKKGVFVKIENNELKVFLPFSKKNFINEWNKKIKVHPKYKDIFGFIKYIQGLENRPFKPQSINKFVDTWYANNCLVRYEFPVTEGDSNNTNMADMLKTLCKERTLPNIEFFINRRDFPILKTDNTEPYNHMFDSTTLPLLSHSYDKYSPILSMAGCENFADIPIPTGDDWARVSRPEGKYFERSATRSFALLPTSWENKKSTAVFRGASTGIGVTIETNPRLKISHLSKITPVEDGVPLLDAGITKWNLRPRKIQGEQYLQTIDVKNLPFDLVSPLTPQQQSDYKYIVNIDGYVSAFRLSLELFSGSCLLIVDSDYHLWFRKNLKPYIHYIPIKQDLSDLLDKIRWCRTHDKECQIIAENGLKYAQQYLTKNAILDYLQKLFVELKTHTGTYLYNSISPYDIQYQEEKKWLEKRYWKQYPETIKQITLENRNLSTLQGIEWAFSHISIPEGTELFNNKLTKIDRINVGEKEWIVKSGLDKTREKEVTHEAFVILSSLNKLVDQVPNFIYGFKYEKNKLVLEQAEGIKLRDYLMGTQFNYSDFILILTQLALAIHIAQVKYGFIHYDLTPWNIILKKSPSTRVEYRTETYGYTLVTNWIPMIIDMGRSHIIYNHTHYGLIQPYRMSTIQDIITLLTTSLYIISGRKNLSRKEVDQTLHIANFMANTKYRPKRFLYRGNDGLGELRYFLRMSKKYTELITSPKHELEIKTPIDFIKYLSPPLVEVKITHSIKGTPRITLDTIFGRQNTLEKFINRILHINTIPTHPIYAYYFIQYTHTLIKNILHKDDYTKCNIHLTNLFKKITDTDFSSIDNYLPPKLQFVYTEYTFENIPKLKEYTSMGFEGKYVDVTDLYETIGWVLHYEGEYKIPETLRTRLEGELQRYKQVSSVEYLTRWATLNTFQRRLKVILKANIKCLKGKYDIADYQEIVRRIN